MSVCESGFGKIPWCPCFHEDDEDGVKFCALTMEAIPDTCPFAAILNALPGASEEVRRITEALLRGYGDIQFYTSPGYRKTVFTWTEREKGGSDE